MTSPNNKSRPRLHCPAPKRPSENLHLRRGAKGKVQAAKGLIQPSVECRSKTIWTFFRLEYHFLGDPINEKPNIRICHLQPVHAGRRFFNLPNRGNYLVCEIDKVRLTSFSVYVWIRLFFWENTQVFHHGWRGGLRLCLRKQQQCWRNSTQHPCRPKIIDKMSRPSGNTHCST